MDQETISKEYEVINRAFKTGDIRQLKHYFELEKDNWKNKPWNIAVTGNYGVGKSSFINAIRNAETGEDLWAEKYVVDITEKPTPYQHPECPNLVFGDMPPTFPQERYLKQVDFRKYDIFLILFSDRLTENYQWLAEEVKKEGKRVFFVRTKIDWDVTNMKRASKIKTNKSDFVEKVRKECINNIKERGLYSDVEETLFMIDNMNPKTFDFEKLETKLIEYFQKEKREGIALSVTNMTEGFIKAKKDVLQKTVYLQAMTSAAAAAVPIPGFDVPVDIAILLRAARDYKEQFGVDEKTVENIARSLGTTVDSLKIKLDLKSLGISTSNKGIKMLCASIAISKGTENAVKFAVPIIGSFIAAGVSYGVCVGCLTSLLNAISDDALKLNREIVRMISNSGTVAEAFE